MLSTDIPARFPIPFAADATAGNIRAIPLTTSTPGAASLTLGYPPITLTPPGAGGIPPAGQDTNGILNQISAWSRWAAAGGPINYDGTFSAAIGGYPKNAVLASATLLGVYWRSTVENNTTNPDDPATTANWLPLGRTKLQGATTFYYSNAGSDATGNGSSGTPWKTPQFAVNTVQQLYDLNGQTVTFQAVDYVGTYGDTIINGGFVGLTNYSNLIFNGNSGTPGNTKVGNIQFNNPGAMGIIQNLTMAGAYGISAGFGGIGAVGANIHFASMSAYQIDCRTNGLIYLTEGYSIDGGATAHISLQGGGTVLTAPGLSFTVNGTPSFAAFVVAIGASKLLADATSTYSGAATGTRYDIEGNSTVVGVGGGVGTPNQNFFPGNSAGTISAPGYYLN